MKALLLAGGLGTRLRPLTETRPKHLLPIANRPHLEHVFDLLAAHAIDEIVLLTSYLAEAFGGVIPTAATRGLRIQVASEPEPLGTAGALKNAEEMLDGDTFIAFNGDILTDADLGALVAAHRDRGATATIMLTPVEDPSAFGVVPTDDDGRVREFIEKPPPGTAPTDLINAGVYVLEPAALASIPSGEVWSAERQLFPHLAGSGSLFAVPTDAYWMDIGTPQKYLQANLDALQGRFVSHPPIQPGPGDTIAAGDAEIAPGASVGLSCIGRGAVIEAGASLDRCVLLPGAVVGAGATVISSILGEGARVRPGAVVTDRVLADLEEV